MLKRASFASRPGKKSLTNPTEFFSKCEVQTSMQSLQAEVKVRKGIGHRRADGLILTRSLHACHVTGRSLAGLL